MTRIDQLLFHREIKALQIVIVFRLLFLFSMMFGTPFGGKSVLETTLVAGLCGPTLLFSIWSIFQLRREKRVRMVGTIGAILDIIIITALPVIWYFSVGGPAVPPAYLIKGPFYQAFLWAILVVNSFAIQPLYLFIVIGGGFLSVSAHLLYLVIDGRTTFTADFIAHNLSSVVTPYFVITSLLMFVIVGVGLVIFVRRIKATVHSAAKSEIAVNQLSRFFSPRIRDELIAEHNQFASDRGRLQDVAVLFSDIRNFTSMCESLPPEDVVSFLKEYHARMVDIIFRHDGTRDKFIGDGIMATFGTPSPTKDDARNSVLAAIDMQRSLADLNALRIADGKEPIRIGIGIHYGQVVVGNVGSENRLEYTVIGDTVNTASRLESATKELHQPIAFSEDVRGRMGDDIPAIMIGDIQLRGRAKGVRVYTVAA
ncbi:MAG: adenylate/guanylate cyclase domain-containing protein [Spirochaetes bacterium]|nr:adenylate/guanylate cyclase domain-containing protein [Spirochaetota bacterium]